VSELALEVKTGADEAAPEVEGSADEAAPEVEESVVADSMGQVAVEDDKEEDTAEEDPAEEDPAEEEPDDLGLRASLCCGGVITPRELTANAGDPSEEVHCGTGEQQVQPVMVAAPEDLGEAPDLIADFVSRATVKLQEALLGSAPVKRSEERGTTPVRRSLRIAKKPGNGATMEMMAMEAVAKRLGSLPPETPFSDRLLQAYLALFDGPLSDQAIAAIEELVLAVKAKKKSLPPAGKRSGLLRPTVVV
jgi:hypothetical protein